MSAVPCAQCGLHEWHVFSNGGLFCSQECSDAFEVRVSLEKPHQALRTLAGKITAADEEKLLQRGELVAVFKGIAEKHKLGHVWEEILESAQQLGREGERNILDWMTRQREG